MANATETELQFLFPETEVEIAGKSFTIKPFSFVETRFVAKKIGSVLHLLTGELTPAVLAEMYDQAFEGLVDVIAKTYQINKKVVEQMDQASAAKAISEIVKVNKDFFVDSVEAEITSLTTAMGMNEEESSHTES